MGKAAAQERSAAGGEPPIGADIVGRHRRLARRAALISALTAASRVLGYGREILSAILFGDRSPAYDAFVTAWRVPNLFRRLLGEGAVSTALQTALTEADGDWGDETGRRLFWAVFRLALKILLALCALLMGGVALMGDSMPVTGWSWLGSSPQAVRELTVRVTPYVLFICLAGLCGGALAVRGRFRTASAGPGAGNLVAIATLVLMGLLYGWSGPSPADGEPGLRRHLDMARFFSWGLLVSGVVQLAMLFPEMVSCGLLRRDRNAPEPPPGALRSARKVLWSSAPLALGAAVYQINVMIDGLMAQGLLSEGGPTTYYFANRIQQLPLALVATAATSAVFPALKAFAHRGDLAEMRRIHDRTHLAIAFLALPATAGLAFLAEPITATLLQHGEFGAQGVERTAGALRVLSLALLPAGAAALVGRAYYALGDFRTPVRVSIAMLALNVLLNTCFVVGLGMDVEGLSLATALVSWINVTVLVPGLLRRIPTEGGRGGARGGPLATMGLDLARMAVAALACGLAALGVHEAAGAGPRSPLALSAAIACGIVTYVISAQLLRIPEWQQLRTRLATRFRPGD